MKRLKNSDYFYDLNEAERKSLVGTMFKTTERKGMSNWLYFPLDLHKDEFNYGVRQGLICISPIEKYKHKKNFKIIVHSPDDLDLCLYFNHYYTPDRQEVINFVKKMPKRNVFYKEVLLEIQKTFGGEIGY